MEPKFWINLSAHCLNFFYHFRELFIIVYTGNFYSTFSVGANLNFYFVNFGDGTEIGIFLIFLSNNIWVRVGNRAKEQSETGAEIK